MIKVALNCLSISLALFVLGLCFYFVYMNFYIINTKYFPGTNFANIFYFSIIPFNFHLCLWKIVNMTTLNENFIFCLLYVLSNASLKSLIKPRDTKIFSLVLLYCSYSFTVLRHSIYSDE